IGEGGMGVVWRAEDTVLGRQVALKLLLESFATDPERLARFEREARFLAALSHPNIAAIHGLEESDGERFLVLELVPGDSLGKRLAQGPLPIKEALRVCCEIAKALEAAHEKGIIHRDLKPHNVMITPEGVVKVLDFGVAKVFGAPAFASEIATRPAVTEETREHATLGTTPYMSPEQASAKPLDKRTDIWAFGCTLYEALSGRRAFPGETVASTIAAIHGREPDWERLPTQTPTRIRELLRRCLAKDLDGRLRDIGDARLEIEAALGELAARPAVAASAAPVRSAGKAAPPAPETAQPVGAASSALAQPAAEMARSGSAGVAPMSLIAELKRRNVFRVAAAYGIVAWLLVEVASVVLPTFNAPEWVMQVLTFLVILGFPLAMILAWAFELTPEGIKLEKTVDRAESITQQTGQKLNYAIIGLLVIAVIFMFVDNYVLEAEPEQVDVTAEQVPAAEPVTREQSIAVLSFVNMSDDPNQEYFADGIAEELLNTLARFENLRVVGRTSSFSFKNSDADLKEIGEALGADVILEGSVRKAGNRVRITAQLIDAENGLHRWSETYDRELTDIFAIQTEIATAIADALRVSLSSEERERLATPPTENLAAYQAYLLGNRRLEKYTIASIEEAIEYFQRAIELDPKFALAYAGLALGYIDQFQDSGSPANELLTRAQGAADKALELDDRLAEAHVALADIRLMRNDFEGAETAFQRALALNPNSVSANFLYGILLGDILARYEEALALIRKALELDPLSLDASWRVGRALNWLGRFDDALASYERVIEIDPDFAFGYLLIGLHHWLVSGRLDEAAVWWAKGAALDPRSAWTFAFLGELFLDLGDPDRAEDWIHRSIELAPEGFYSNLVMQELAMYRGDEAAALEHGRKAFAIQPLALWTLTYLRDHEVRAGRYIEARALYEEHFPELLSEHDPKVDLRNYRAAVDLAMILSKTGHQEQADLLLDRSLQQIQRRPRLGEQGYGIADVQVYALRGEKQQALSALRQAIDEGWRADWWYELQHKPDLESLHDEPEFQAMVAEIEADMAAQLARVREMERNGELEPIPEVSATVH
ncbi:MAG: protein kinase, partial [Deltaproteobacteria bacterium]|nr:protein kinase [Deltaproteobacteria bacterium]